MAAPALSSSRPWNERLNPDGTPYVRDWVRDYSHVSPASRGTMVTRLYIGPWWHVKWFIIGLLTGGLGWFIWPFAYAARKKPRTVTSWE